MNKKALAIVTSLLVVVLIGVGGLFYFLSFKTATFTIVPDNTEIIVYNKNNNEVGRLTQDGSLRLQNGDYTATPSNEEYSRTPIAFTVADQDVAVTIDPSYSFDRLSKIREAEEPTIFQKLRETYASIINQFKLEEGKVYQKGDWYATVLAQNYLPGGQQGDIYKVVLQKIDGEWKIVAGPEIILTLPQNPDVPDDILIDINARQ